MDVHNALAVASLSPARRSVDHFQHSVKGAWTVLSQRERAIRVLLPSHGSLTAKFTSQSAVMTECHACITSANSSSMVKKPSRYTTSDRPVTVAVSLVLTLVYLLIVPCGVSSAASCRIPDRVGLEVSDLLEVRVFLILAYSGEIRRTRLLGV
jgi:hypothetical protein